MDLCRREREDGGKAWLVGTKGLMMWSLLSLWRSHSSCHWWRM